MASHSLADAPDLTPKEPHPLDIPVPVRWTDLDAYGHVNNAAVVRLLEEARIAAFWQPPAEQLELGAPQPPAALPVSGAGSALSTVIASQRIEYARPLGHRRDGVIVRLWLSRIGGASLSIDYLVLTRDDPEGTAPYARARTVVVLIDAESGAPVRLDQETRDRLQQFSGEPQRFRD
ncbi:thioesterase family protein [Brachybacterium paraconglomeratum]|uniref:acyl-CoA thioesterase n=1 Tax=Brachybacterium paraconglomeratum TaxID=173362 RepID=UPI0031F0BF7F